MDNKINNYYSTTELIISPPTTLLVGSLNTNSIDHNDNVLYYI